MTECLAQINLSHILLESSWSVFAAAGSSDGRCVADEISAMNRRSSESIASASTPVMHVHHHITLAGFRWRGHCHCVVLSGTSFTGVEQQAGEFLCAPAGFYAKETGV